MKNLISTTETQTMSSLEISKVTGKEHSKVMADIKRVLNEAEIDHAGFGGIFLDAYKREQPCFNLPRRECDLIIAGYSVKYRLAIIDRWQELEAQQQAFKVPTNFIEAMQLATTTLIENQALQETIGRKDQLLLASNEASIKAGEILIREFVKSNDCIELGEHQFFHWMRDQKIISEKNEPFQRFVSAGYFTFKPTEEMHGGKFRYTLRVTARGKIWLASKYLNFLDRGL